MNQQLAKVHQGFKAKFVALECLFSVKERGPVATCPARIKRVDAVHPVCVYQLATKDCSTIQDFLEITELGIVDKVTYESVMERLTDPKLALKAIKSECRKQVADLFSLVK